MLKRIVGKWTEKTGKILVIRTDGQQVLVDFYKNFGLIQ